MRILMCAWKDCAHPAAGGAEVFTREVMHHWIDSGHDVTLFVASVDGRLADEIVDGVRVIRRGGRLGVYREARRFYERGEAGRVDLIVDQINTRPFGSPSWRGEAQVVGLAHQVAREIWMHELPLPVALVGRYWLEPHWLRAYRRVKVLTVSASSARSLKEFGLQQVSVVPIGSEQRPFEQVCKDTQPTLIFVGRLASNKRPDHAIAAFARIRTHMPEARLWVVGTGPMERALRARAVPGVTFFGRISDLDKRALVARAHFLVATSVREGWGLVVDEAAAVGTRTIAYAVDGLRDSVPAAGGFLVEPYPRALADAALHHLPPVLADPPTGGWHGGARPWSEVADAILAEAQGAQPALRARAAV